MVFSWITRYSETSKTKCVPSKFWLLDTSPDGIRYVNNFNVEAIDLIQDGNHEPEFFSLFEIVEGCRQGRMTWP